MIATSIALAAASDGALALDRGLAAHPTLAIVAFAERLAAQLQGILYEHESG